MFKTFFIALALLFCTNSAWADMSFANRPAVKSFINEMVAKHHFSKPALIRIFASVKIRPAVIHNLKAPLEQKPWYTYQMLFVTEWRIREGVKFWNKYHDVLARAEREFGVPASIIVATIGVETKYGENTGNFRVIDALANIAFGDTTRTKFFKKELEEFLLLTREQNLDPLKVMGSYAGAIGQPQFMPSSYRHYAVNFSGNSTIDLSHNEVDVIGSIANYYHKHGWQFNQAIIIPATINETRYRQALTASNQDNKTSIQLLRNQLSSYGITPNGRMPDQEKLRLIEFQGHTGPEYWIGFKNFDVIKRYNPSDLYAMAIYQLSYYITALREKDNV